MAGGSRISKDTSTERPWLFSVVAEVEFSQYPIRQFWSNRISG
jgi:hypothetical protein